MKQMIEIIVDDYEQRRTYSSEEIQKLGSYLAGKADFESVEGLLPKTHVYYASRVTMDLFAYCHYTISRRREALREIAQECMEKPELLPRLGRFLTFLKDTGPKFFAVVHMLMDNEMPFAKIFIETGIGPAAIVEFMYYMEYVGYMSVDDCKHSGCETKMLEHMDSSHPGVLEACLERIDEDMPFPCSLAWFCGRHGIDLNSEHPFAQKLTETMLYFGGCTALYTKKDVSFRSYLQSIDPTLADMLEKGPVADKIRQTDLYQSIDMARKSGLYKTRRGSPFAYGGQMREDFFRALCLSGFGLNTMNGIFRALYCADFPRFFDILLDTLRPLRGYMAEDVMRKMRDLEAIVHKMGLHTSSLYAWAHSKRQYEPLLWTDALRQLKTDPEVLRMALKVASPVARTSIHRFLHDCGQPLDEDAAHACVELLQSFVPQDCLEDGERLGRYLLTGEGDVTTLPWISQIPSYHLDFSLDVSIWAFAGIHPIALRYANYLAVHNEYGHIKNMVEYFENAYGWNVQQMAEFLMGSGLRSYMISALAIGRKDKESAIMSVFPICITMDLDAVAEAVKIAPYWQKPDLLREVYKIKPDYNEDLLIRCLGDKSKELRQSAYDYLSARPELADKIRPLTESKKKDIRELALRLMAVYEDGQETDWDITAYCGKTLPKNGPASIKWAFPDGPPSVRLQNSEQKAEDIIVQCYYYLMLSNKAMDMPPAAPRLRAALNEDDLHRTACQVYDRWIANNAPTAQKAALFLYAVHSKDADVSVLHKQLSKWADASRGAIAADAVRAMLYSASNMALTAIDSIAYNFKYKMIKEAAQKVLVDAPAILGILAEVWGDRIVPTLGFDTNGEKVIDYGIRTLTAFLTPRLEVGLRDENSQTIKSLPKPDAKDDVETMERIKKEFTALKKRHKGVVTAQTQRLEQALSGKRRWEPSAWKTFFVQNPIMRTLAAGLIWGTYDGENTLRKVFRPVGNGTFVTVENEAFDFNGIDTDSIGLVHPLDLGEENTAAWRRHLEKGKVAQPISQIDCLIADESPSGISKPSLWSWNWVEKPWEDNID